MGLNLNTAAGLATLTLSNASGVLNQLAGLNNATWDIQEAAYGHPPNKLVRFHIFKSAAAADLKSGESLGLLGRLKDDFLPTANDYEGAVSQIQDSISRRVVPFEYPYVDGQTTDDLGKSGQSYEFDVLLFGKGYYAAYLALIKEFDDKRPGTLVHPIYGPITAKFKQATVTHKSEAREALAMKVTFLSHDFEVSFQDAKKTTKSALATAVGFIGSINNIITKIQSNIATFSIVKSAIIGLVKGYSDLFSSSLVALNTTFNNGTSSDIPGLLPNNSAQGTAFVSGVSPNDPFANVTLSEIQSQQSPVLASLQAADRVIALRVYLTNLILTLENLAVNGVLKSGSLEFYDDILVLKQSGVAVQQVLELGLQSSNATIKNYTTPRLMSVREVCFLNGLSVDRSFEVEQLNPDSLSMNFLEKGSILKVPTA